METKFGRAVSISTPKYTKNVIETIKKDDYIFLSLHIQEEFNSNKDYVSKCEELCKQVVAKKARIIADVSIKTKRFFNENDLVKLAKRLGIYALRIDYGLTLEEISDIAKRMPIAINATTSDIDSIKKIKNNAKKVITVHNYYPRPETGLDWDFFINKTKQLKDIGVEVMAFIHGDEELRSPLYLGLPSVEHQRSYTPYASFIELTSLDMLDAIIVGDPTLSQKQVTLINEYIDTNIISLQAKIDKSYSIYDKIFTNRIDSPSKLIRIYESREYSCFGKEITPNNNVTRNIGAITIDNAQYMRYSGEMMIVRETLEKDKRVNVIGQINKDYLPILKYIKGGQKFKFIKA